MSVAPHRSQRIRSKAKSSTELFFSYKSVLANHESWNCMYQFEWEGIYGYVFNTIFSWGHDTSYWIRLNRTTLGSLWKPFKSPRLKPRHYKVPTSDALGSFSRVNSVVYNFNELYYLQQTLTFVELTRYWWNTQTRRVFLAPLVRREQFTWARYSLVWSYVSIYQNIQSFNLLMKSLLRHYFKFHNYWFEYVRLTPIFQSNTSILFSAFLHADLIRIHKSPLSNRSKLIKCPNRAPLQTPLPLNYDLLQNWHGLNHVLHKRQPRSQSHVLRRLSTRVPFTTFTRRTNSFTTRTQQPDFKKLLSSFVPKHYRQLKRNHRQKTYKMRNKCWRSLFQIYRSYSTSLKIFRDLRRARVHRKFIPRIVRTISTYTAFTQPISYKSLLTTPKFAYLLTRDSLTATLQTSPGQQRSRISTLYSLILPQLRLTSTYFNEQTDRTRANILTHVRCPSPISAQLAPAFTSRESLAELIRQNNIILWKYSLISSILRNWTYSLDYSWNYFLTSSAYIMTYIIQTQAHLYHFTSKRRYLVHSNLSVLHLEELYRSVVTYKMVDSTIVRYYSTRYMRPSGFLWYYTSLIQFLEHTTGRKIALNFGPFLETALTFKDRAKCLNWKRRILGFQRLLGPKIFIYEALEILVVSIRLKDPTFLANWIRAMLARISFWKYRVIFRYLKFLLQNLIRSSFDHFSFKGAKFRLKGKISVAGNARTRMVFYKIGSTSHTTMAYRIAYDLSYVHTFTGVQGFKIWFFY